MWMRLIRSHVLDAGTIKAVVDSYRREDLPRIQDTKGFLGIALGENPVGGNIASVTFWETEEHMRATEQYSADARKRALPMFDRADPAIVDHYEVAHTTDLAPVAAAVERPHMRLVRYAGLTREAIEQATHSYREDARVWQETPGLRGVVIGASRDDSVAVVTFWESEAALTEADQRSRQAREHATSVAKIPHRPLVDRFEVTVASHLDRLAGFGGQR